MNLKKYVLFHGKWQFVSVLKIEGKPRPEAVLIDGEAVTKTHGTFYVEWWEGAKRIQRPARQTSRVALDA